MWCAMLPENLVGFDPKLPSVRLCLPSLSVLCLTFSLFFLTNISLGCILIHNFHKNTVLRVCPYTMRHVDCRIYFRINWLEFSSYLCIKHPHPHYTLLEFSAGSRWIIEHGIQGFRTSMWNGLASSFLEAFSIIKGSQKCWF